MTVHLKVPSNVKVLSLQHKHTCKLPDSAPPGRVISGVKSELWQLWLICQLAMYGVSLQERPFLPRQCSRGPWRVSLSSLSSTGLRMSLPSAALPGTPRPAIVSTISLGNSLDTGIPSGCFSIEAPH